MTLFCGTCEGGKKSSPGRKWAGGKRRKQKLHIKRRLQQLSNSPQVACKCPTCKSMEIYSSYHYQNWAFGVLNDLFNALHCTVRQSKSFESCGGDVPNTIEREKAYEKDTIERGNERTKGQIWVNAEISGARIYLPGFRVKKELSCVFFANQ